MDGELQTIELATVLKQKNRHQRGLN